MLGYVDQHYTRALAPELSARELVSLQLGLRGVSGTERLRRADELLERVGLAEKRDRHPTQLSGGEQQRVALCAALAHGPKVFLADEPTGELDAATADRVYDLIGELARENGATTLIVSHDPESARVADRIVRIRDGRVSEEWARDEAESDTIVVGRGGWLRLPEELLLRAGIGDRARATLESGTVVVTPASKTASNNVLLAPETPGPARATEVVASVRGLSKAYGETHGARRARRVVPRRSAPRDHRARPARGRRHSCTCSPGSSFRTRARSRSPASSSPHLDRAARAAHRRAAIAYVGQQAGLVPHLSALENVELALTLRGIDGDAPACARCARIGRSRRAHAAARLAPLPGRTRAHRDRARHRRAAEAAARRRADLAPRPGRTRSPFRSCSPGSLATRAPPCSARRTTRS